MRYFITFILIKKIFTAKKEVENRDKCIAVTTITRYDWEKDELHEGLFWVEVNDDEVWVEWVVVALVDSPGRVVPTVLPENVVEVHALHWQRVHATLDIDLKPEIQF